MVSIVTTHHNRKPQFINTLRTLEKTSVKDLELIVVDDSTEEDQVFHPDDTTLPSKLIRINPEEKWWVNPCINWNMGFRECKGDIILLQTSETMQVGDAVAYAAEHCKDGVYLTFACYSLDKDTTEKILNTGEKSPATKVLSMTQVLPKTVSFDGDAGWYNHPVYRPVGFHFSAALTMHDLQELGGFDESYAMGRGWDDSELINRIQKANIEIRYVTNPYALHQWHYSSNPWTKATQDNSIKYQETMNNPEWRRNCLREPLLQP